MLSYLYSFTVWPDETKCASHGAAIYALFEHLGPPRVEMRFTADAFGDFRRELLLAGRTLREIERRLDIDPEIVL